MTRIITDQPTIEQLETFAQHLDGDDPQWEGTDFGLNLRDIIAYARDGLKQRDDNIAFGDEMERQEKNEIYGGWDENYYALQLEGRAYGPYNPEQARNDHEWMLDTAESVLYRVGSYTGEGDQPAAVASFIDWIETDTGQTDARQSYFGTKNYAQWHSQRADVIYGYTPQHGTTNFALGLKEHARDRDLKDYEKDALVYYLKNIREIDAGKKVQKRLVVENY